MKFRPLPPLENAMKRAGENIEIARKRRQWTEAMMAERIGVSRKTYAKIESGDPSVSWGAVAFALFVLGMTEQIENLGAPEKDPTGLRLSEDRLPKRVRRPRRRD
ncbi:helix-turn-helix transcriptional regulator [Thioalkalivibrio sp. ALE14]|uniref:helix-turn-helix transcriptional regulator n=1 Tax=Thioalkalivibrio sp. ALE14 TaxID=1158168 RepID=UPI000361BE85|nr:helix-turn-helix transcriptional regulator [Thioalkalivibrio sp. ALE14]